MKSNRINTIRAQRDKIAEIKARVPSAHLFAFRGGQVHYRAHHIGGIYGVKHSETFSTKGE